MTNPGSNNNWAVRSDPYSGGGATVFGGGGDPVAPASAAARLSKLRMGENRLPEADYPDGYIGTVNGRQQGKQEDRLQTRLQDRAYQRGVHKATKMGPDQYYWPSDFGPMSGIENEMHARRSGNVILVPKFTSSGDPTERYNSGMPVSDSDMARLYRMYGINTTTGEGTDNLVSPARRAVLDKMLPSYRSGA